MRQRRCFTLVVATLAVAYANAPSARAQNFCAAIYGLGQAAQSGFRDIRGAQASPGSRRYQATLVLPNAEGCHIRESASGRSASYECSWEQSTEAEFRTLAQGIGGCMGTRVEWEQYAEGPSASIEVGPVQFHAWHDRDFRVTYLVVD